MCLGGEIGRRTGLKILWEFIPCRFKSGPRHHKRKRYAGVAQLVERQPSKLNVASSNLVSRSINASLAQLVEHQTLNQEVTGSTPV